VLKKHRPHITIGGQVNPEAINIGYVTTWRSLPKTAQEYRVSIRADCRRLFDVDFEILQNPTCVKDDRQVYLTYWPIPRLKPRKSTRNKVENIAYAGRIGKRNIATGLSGNNKISGLNFQVIEKEFWHDMSEIDVLLAIRDFSALTYDEKPPSKLINSWHSGIPLIAGYDSAFSAIGTPDVDYIQIKTEKELNEALTRLRDDSEFYDSIVKAGYQKSQLYSREKIKQEWFSAIDESIVNDFEDFRLKRPIRRLSKKCNHLVDYAFNIISSCKSALIVQVN
jgi:glycosyltransferase involved in cell wall biosynthesis